MQYNKTKSVDEQKVAERKRKIKGKSNKNKSAKPTAKTDTMAKTKAESNQGKKKANRVGKSYNANIKKTKYRFLKNIKYPKISYFKIQYIPEILERMYNM